MTQRRRIIRTSAALASAVLSIYARIPNSLLRFWSGLNYAVKFVTFMLGQFGEVKLLFSPLKHEIPAM